VGSAEELMSSLSAEERKMRRTRERRGNREYKYGNIKIKKKK